MKFISKLFFLAFTTITIGQEISLVADLNNTHSRVDEPHCLYIFKDKLYYDFNDSITYAFDGINTAKLVYSLNNQSGFYVTDNLVFIITYQYKVGSTLWKYDGIKSPEKIADFKYNQDSYIPSNLKWFNEKLYFNVNDGIHGKELWVYNDSTSPYLLSDITNGIVGSNPQNLVVFNNKLFFTIDDGSLWVYDGVNPPILDTKSGIISENTLVVFNNKLCYAGYDSTFGNALMEYDGFNPPEIVLDFNDDIPFTSFLNFKILNNKLYLNLYDSNISNHIWAYDGFNPPTIVNELEGLTSVSSEPRLLGIYSNKLFFANRNNSNALWLYDGNSAPYVLSTFGGSLYYLLEFKDILYVGTFIGHIGGSFWSFDGINPPERAWLGGSAGSEPYAKTVFNNKLYFMADDGINGFDLWEYDGSNPPVNKADINAGTTYTETVKLVSSKNKLFIINSENIWVFDGANPLTEISIDGYRQFDSPCIILNDNLYFQLQNTGFNTKSIWSYDGLTSPVEIVKDAGYWNCGSMDTLNSKLYFSAYDSVHGNELWVIDGTNSATMVADIKSGISGSMPDFFVVLKNKLYFTAIDQTNRRWLWVYDGINFPSKVYDIIRGSGSSYINEIIDFNDKLYFIGEDSINRNSRLCSYDENSKLSIVTEDVDIINFHLINNKLYYTIYNMRREYEFWEYDGFSSPIMLTNFNNRSSSYPPSNLISYKDKIYFSAFGGEYYSTLWEYDGINKVSNLNDVNKKYFGIYVDDLILFKNKLYFTAAEVSGSELYVLSQPDTVIDIQSCSQYNFNGTILTTSGIYYDTIPGTSVIDSVIKLNLTIGRKTSTINPDACNSFTSPSGKYIWLSSGIYTDTIPAFDGCDSIITVNLKIGKTTSTINSINCERYISPSGKIWFASGIYTDTIPNAAGCDSIITINLTIKNSSNSSINETVCYSYTSPGGKVWTISGEYKDTIPNAAGCDSIITINLTINNSTSSTIQPKVCDNYTSPSGRYIWEQSGTYLDTIPNACGCDSVITIELNISNVDPTVTLDNSEISSIDEMAHHQWVDCNNDYSPIKGETGQSFKPTKAGNYAVVVSYGWCAETSECVQVNTTGIEPSPIESGISVYPNPTNGKFTIDLGKEYEDAIITISQLDGRLILKKQVEGMQQVDIDLESPAGIYLVTIATQKECSFYRIVKSK